MASKESIALYGAKFKPGGYDLTEKNDYYSFIELGSRIGLNGGRGV